MTVYAGGEIPGTEPTHLGLWGVLHGNLTCQGNWHVNCGPESPLWSYIAQLPAQGGSGNQVMCRGFYQASAGPHRNAKQTSKFWP